jgi:hypothetical protein
MNMTAISKWKHPALVKHFQCRIPGTICLGCILDEMWEGIPASLQEELIKKYAELAMVGVTIHAPWCAKRKQTQ